MLIWLVFLAQTSVGFAACGASSHHTATAIAVVPPEPQADRVVAGEDRLLAFLDGLRASPKLADRPWAEIEPTLAAYRDASVAFARLTRDGAAAGDLAAAEQTLSQRRRAALWGVCDRVLGLADALAIHHDNVLKYGYLLPPKPADRPRKRTLDDLSAREREQLLEIRNRVQASRAEFNRHAHWSVLLRAVAEHAAKSSPAPKKSGLSILRDAEHSTLVAAELGLGDLAIADDASVVPRNVDWSTEWFEDALKKKDQVARELPAIARRLLADYLGVTDAAVLDRVSRP